MVIIEALHCDSGEEHSLWISSADEYKLTLADDEIEPDRLVVDGKTLAVGTMTPYYFGVSEATLRLLKKLGILNGFWKAKKFNITRMCRDVSKEECKILKSERKYTLGKKRGLKVNSETAELMLMLDMIDNKFIRELD